MDVTKFGLVADGMTDNTAALQALIDAQPAGIYNAQNPPGGMCFDFPPGIYIVNGADFCRFNCYAIRGYRATLLSNKPGVTIIRAANGTSTFQIRGLTLNSPAGTCLAFASPINPVIEDVCFRGLNGVANPIGGLFGGAFRRNKFFGNGQGIGLQIQGPAALCLEENEFDGWLEAARLHGTGASMDGFNIRRCKTGLRLGVTAAGGNGTLGRTSFVRGRISDCDVGIDAQSVGACYFDDVQIKGTSGAPSGQSQYGLLAGFLNSTYVAGITTSGTFAKAPTAIKQQNNATTVAPPRVPISPPNICDVTAATLVFSRPNVIDVTTAGIVGDGHNDNGPKIQSLLSFMQPGDTLRFPAGKYMTSRPLDFSRLANCSIVGECASCAGAQNGTTIMATFQGDLVIADYGTGAGTFSLEGLNLWANAGAAVFARNAVLARLSACTLRGAAGAHLEFPYRCALQSLELAADVGIQLHNDVLCTIDGCNANGIKEGIRSGGSMGLAIFASRFEVCGIGINVGIGPSGELAPCSYVSIQGISGEANDFWMRLVGLHNSLIAGSGAAGTPNAPSGRSTTGIAAIDCHQVDFLGVQTSGAYGGYPIDIDAACEGLQFVSCMVSNGAPGGAARLWNDQGVGTIRTASP